MKQEINPNDTSRAQAFELWMMSPMPMVTLIKTYDVTRLMKVSRRSGIKFNALLCWCIAKAASQMPEFYLMLIGDKLFQFDCLAVNVIVKTRNGEINNCDIPFSDDIRQFERDYLKITKQVYESDETYSLEDEYAIIGTSAVPQCYIDGAVNQYSGVWNNSFLSWGCYRRHFMKTFLPISMQFHHVLLDGGDAAVFLNRVQSEISNLKC